MKNVSAFTPALFSLLLLGCPGKKAKDSLDAAPAKETASLEEQCLQQPGKIFKDGQCLEMSTHKGGEVAGNGEDTEAATPAQLDSSKESESEGDSSESGKSAEKSDSDSKIEEEDQGKSKDSESGE